MAFTDTQIKALSAKLSAKHVKTRNKAGVTLSYIEGWHAIAEANRIFGFAGWDRETIETNCVWQHHRQGQNEAAYTVRVRVRVRAGDTEITREGSGSGRGWGPNPAEAHESALKEAETDAMKRALSTFGNPFGLCLYDKAKRGVRQLSRKGPGARKVAWTVLSQMGEPVGHHEDPVEFCSALRRRLEDTESHEDLKAFWSRNNKRVEELRRTLPDLKTDKGEHYADILAALYQRRIEESAKREKIKKIQVKDPQRVAADQRTEKDEPTRDQQEGQIDKSILALPSAKRIRDKEHLRSVVTQPCLICGRMPCQAHHVRFAQPRALGRKVSDEWAVPLCALHHRSLHDAGDERRWWKCNRIDPLAVAERLWGERNEFQNKPINRQIKIPI